MSDDFVKDLAAAIDLLENEDYSSMVIYADGNNFSVGANLKLMMKAHEEGTVDRDIGEGVDNLHYSFSSCNNRFQSIFQSTETIV